MVDLFASFAVRDDGLNNSNIGWVIKALRVPMFDEIAIYVSSVSLSCTYHESAV